VKTRAFTVAAAIAVLLTASAFAWERRGGEQAPANSDILQAQTAPAQAAQTPAPGPTEAAPLTHRESVRKDFSCFDCHGVDRGFLMPEDHRPMAATECTNCHKPAPEPPPISLHDDSHQQSPGEQCAACHKTSGAPQKPATITKGTCFNCHGDQTEKVLPASHAMRSDAATVCFVCHQTKQVAIPIVPHKTYGYENCTFCHGPSRLTTLEGAHVNQPAERCLTCHQVVQPPAIYTRMHALADATQGCTSCHAPAAIAPLPASHEGRTELMCALCHQPAAPDEQPPDVPHPLTETGVCASCHAASQVGSLPWDHQTRTEQTCTICHAERPGGVPSIPHALTNRAVCTECHAPSKDAVPVN
jgi:hypothetical protein